MQQVEKASKEDLRAERVLKRAKWMVYDGPDTVVVDHMREGQQDLVFKAGIPVNVVGYNDIITTYPRLVNLVKDNKLRSISKKVAEKMLSEKRCLEISMKVPIKPKTREVSGEDKPEVEIDLGREQGNALLMEPLMKAINAINENNQNTAHDTGSSTIANLARNLEAQQPKKEEEDKGKCSSDPLEDLRKQSHALVDSAINTLCAWEQYRRR